MKEWKKFENDLNETCLRYRKEKKALIEYIKVGVTNDGRPKTSTVDFKGITSPNGRGFAFDAKTTENKNSFAFKNIKSHQIIFLKYHEIVGGESYIFLRFNNVNKYKEFYKIPISFILNKIADKKKSVKISELDDNWLTSTEDFI